MTDSSIEGRITYVTRFQQQNNYVVFGHTVEKVVSMGET